MRSMLARLGSIPLPGGAPGPALEVAGAHGSLSSLVVAHLAARRQGPPLLVLCRDEARAQQLVEEVGVFWSPGRETDDPLGTSAALVLPEVDSSPYSDLAPDRRSTQGRLAALFRLLHGLHGPLVVLSLSSLLRRVIAPDLLDARCELVVEGGSLDREQFAEALQRAGYQRLGLVEDPGTFTVRGGVVDFFAPVYRYPLRVELFGDKVQSLRLFEPETQRTLRRVDHAYLHPVRETLVTTGATPRERLLEAADVSGHPSSRVRFLLSQIDEGADFFGAEALVPIFHKRMAPIWDYLPPGAGWVVEEPEALWAAAGALMEELGRAYSERISEHQLALPPASLFLDPAEARALVESRSPLHLVRLADSLSVSPCLTLGAENHQAVVYEVRRLQAERGQEVLGPLVQALTECLSRGIAPVLVSPEGRSVQRMEELLGRHGLPVVALGKSDGHPLPGPGPAKAVELRRGHLSQGFTLPELGVAFFAEEELFGAKVRRAKKGARRAPRLGDLSELRVGDFVVHQLHGVGRYEGLRREEVRGVGGDFMLITYQGDTRLYLPVHRFGEVQRYVAGEGRPPRLDRLGGATFSKNRRKVTESVRKLAETLLQLYAQRQALPGHASPPPDELYRAFEATFPFEETEDQQAAIEAVEEDLQSPRPMDRLVCGDVGYGKTEIALRAAVLTALGGRQVALLAPTTVLVEQHGVTFSERLKSFPVRVATLSRFRPKQAQQRTVEAIARGEIDIVIGTHRLLSGDLRFKSLGLLIIDEEQRFGVAHKERLKELRTQVDVLTLTATPIPRTLHMSLLGLRDLSLITTPPSDRLAVRTSVCVSSPQVIREGVWRELQRGGQVFFVVPRIGVEGAPEPRRGRQDPGVPVLLQAPATKSSLSWWAEQIRRMVPEARVAEAHGQLDDRALERVMAEFVAGQHDVLVCTSIVESGLDIPRANTMFIQDADNFGLAQLYQLRGRIGRGRERAHCLLMVSSLSVITPEARQRLEALQRFSDLGAGFNLASTDLEIRGTGDLLGGKQSGNIAQVGFEEYQRIMEEAVSELRGEPLSRQEDPELQTDLPSFLPDDYIEDGAHRLGYYRKYADIRSESDAEELLGELSDRFGSPPKQAEVLGGLMVLKSLARSIKAKAVELTGRRLVLGLSEDTVIDPGFVRDLVSRRGSPWRFTPDFRLSRLLESSADLERLEEAKNSLRVLRASVR